MKLHLGCGPHVKAGWDNYDWEPGPGGILWDLRKPLALIAGSASFIFTEHFIEHLDREQGQRFLAECYRLLAPGGVLRIITPDLGDLAQAYLSRRLISLPGTWSPTTLARMFNEALRLWGHQFVYDRDELMDALEAEGFGPIKMVIHQQSEHPELAGIDVRPYNGELIMEATK